jgi:hypothetical protein
MIHRSGHRRAGAARTTGAMVLALLAAGLLPAHAAEHATDTAPAAAEGEADPGPKLEFEALLYGWVTGTYGSIGVGDTTVRLDVGPDDVLELLFDGDALAGAGYFSVSWDRFSLFTDTLGGYAETHVRQTIPTQLCCTLKIDAETTMKFVVADFALGYRLGQWTLPKRERPLTLGAYAGARYVYLSNDVDATVGVVGGTQRSAAVFESLDWADPLVGIRWSVPILDPVSLDFRGDIGGFGASSDLTWGLVGALRWWLPFKPFGGTTYLAAGYRVVAFERSPSGGDVDMQMRGPMMGGGGIF